MRIIISPAKKMNVDTDTFPVRDLPVFLSRTQQILDVLQSKTPEELKTLWKCNEKIAALNIDRLSKMDLYGQLTPAILSYEGIQYQYMAPSVFTNQEYQYIQEHLRILSGFYGILRPFDGVTPYRLEMQAKLNICDAKDLYGYWGRGIAEAIFAESSCVLNLASKEYSQCVAKYLRPGIRFITCIFGEEKDGKVIEKGTMCKMARGEMVRYMAERQIEAVEEIRGFDRLGYVYAPERSDECTYVFVKKGTDECSLD